MRRKKKKTPSEASAATEAPLQPAYPEPELGTESQEQTENIVASASDDAEPVPESKAAAPARTRRRKKKKVQPALEEPRPVEEQEPVSAPPDEVELPAVQEEQQPAPAPVEEAPAPAPQVAPDQNAQAAREQNAPVAHEQKAEKPRRASKGAVVLAVGLPGSGKSTWFKRRGVTPLSSDMVRHLLFDSPTEQRYQDLVFGTLRSLLRARLIARMPLNYVDATNLSPKERRHWIKMAKDFGYEVHAVYFDVPLEVCVERNQKRNRVVPEDVMQRMAAKLKPPTFDEGFSKIVVVRVKHKTAGPATVHLAEGVQSHADSAADNDPAAEETE